MEEILLFAQIFVLLLEKLRGLVLIDAMLFVNDSTDLNDPKTSWWYIAKHALSRRLRFMARFFTSGMKKPILNIFIIPLSVLIF